MERFTPAFGFSSEWQEMQCALRKAIGSAAGASDPPPPKHRIIRSIDGGLAEGRGQGRRSANERYVSTSLNASRLAARETRRRKRQTASVEPICGSEIEERTRWEAGSPT